MLGNPCTRMEPMLGVAPKHRKLDISIILGVK